MNQTQENPSGPRIGIIGDGQLARMLALAAVPLGCEVIVLKGSGSSPAAIPFTRSKEGGSDSLAPLLELAAATDVVTLENEFVDSELLHQLEQRGHTVLPSARTIALVQDKLIQKQTLGAAGLPIPQILPVNDLPALTEAAAHLGYPFLLKARRNGYDGRGNATIQTPADLEPAWKKLGGDRGHLLMAEKFCRFTGELAVIVTRSRTGEIATYPVVETIQRNHVCHLVRAPADIPPAVADRAAEIARRAAEIVGMTGSMGVELFLMPDGALVVNELAPRVHNSGHYTIEACTCSQFENHIRAILGLPLGSTQMTAPAAVMLNLLGTREGTGRPRGLEHALATPGAHAHLYGKTTSKPGRKLGHVTALGPTPTAAENTAQSCAKHITFGEAT